MEQFGIGRVSVRQALKTLEATGLVVIRVGGGGGPFVGAPQLHRVGLSIMDLLHQATLRPDQLDEFRCILELSMLELICQRANDRDFTDLLEICDEGDALASRGEVFPLSLSADFHIRMAAATRNNVLETLARCLHGEVLIQLRTLDGRADRVGTVGNVEHRALVNALRDRDGVAAHSIMRMHLARVSRHLALLGVRSWIVESQ